ncbi:hypothetical protein IHE45_18G022800 [Dioscorea alata]|uniref:Uncharacterized protein n=1 Tax=Dioscorea alata TaxID=55571 RepID=A0ACB7U5J4_DIOAL|nr:hypothetical protein IHE45_18G022800 [Dioscorea alata]
MEAKNQEVKRVEENLRALLKEQLEKQAERHDQAIRELKEQQDKVMKEMRSLLLNLQPIQTGNTDSIIVVAVRSELELAYSKTIQPKLTRLELPRFNGDGLYDWLYRCNQYFELDDTTDSVKIKIASIHMEDRALQWHRNYLRCRKDRGVVLWKDYVAAMNV